MALKNFEEAMVDRIRRAVAKELRALRRRAAAAGNGHVRHGRLTREAEAMAVDAMTGRSSRRARS
jgi:hypothetical protein